MAPGRCGRAAALAIAVCGLWPVVAQAAPGDLDPSFGTGGVVRTHIGAADSFDRSDAMVLDGSGRAVVVGTTSTPIGDSELVIARYLSDGSLDSSFGSGGVVKSSAGYPHAVTLDADGKIVVAGQIDGESFNTDVMVARFLASGAPDTSFGGGDGVVTTDFTGEFDSARAVAIDGSGRIVIAGGAPNILLARYLANGDLDTSFGGGDGFVAETIDELFGIFGGFRDLVIDGSGRIVAVGGGFVAMRFLASGALDTSFGDEGMVSHRVAEDDEATAVAIDSEGNLLVGGRTGEFLEGLTNFDFAVVRYDEAGVLDSDFGDGESMAVADADAFDAATDMAVDENGRIVLGGVADDFAAVRFLPSGRISGSFGGGDGIVTTDLDGEGFSTAVAVDASGRIVLSGSVHEEDAEENGFADFALLRYEGGPAVDVFHELDVQTAGEGEGTVTGPGIDCGSECTATYDEGTIMTLTAIPAHDELLEAEAIFTGWSGDCAGEAETCQVTMDAAKEVTATFAPLAEEPPVEEPPTEEEPPSEPPDEQSPTNPLAPPPASFPLVTGNQSPEAPPRAVLATAAGVAPVKGAAALMRLRCRGQVACRGIAKLVARVRLRRGARRSAAKNIELGRTRFRVPAGRTKALRIRLNRKGRRLLRRAGRRGLRVRLVGRGLRNRAVRLKQWQGKRRRSRARRMLLSTHSSGQGRRAKPGRRTVYPVQITIKHRKAPRSGCPTCEAFFGAVRSTKLACKRGRKVLGAVTYPKNIFGGKTYEESFGRTDQRGRWKREFIAIEPLARAGASVERKRLRSGAVCRPAQASVRYRR